MTLDLLLLFISLGVMLIVFSLKKPIPLLITASVAQWWLGAALMDQLNYPQASSDPGAIAIELGMRCGLVVAGLLLFHKSYVKLTALRFLMLVVWAVVFSGMVINILAPLVNAGGGFFYSMLIDNLVIAQTIVLALAVMSELRLSKS